MFAMLPIFNPVVVLTGILAPIILALRYLDYLG